MTVAVTLAAAVACALPPLPALAAAAPKPGVVTGSSSAAPATAAGSATAAGTATAASTATTAGTATAAGTARAGTGTSPGAAAPTGATATPGTTTVPPASGGTAAPATPATTPTTTFVPHSGGGTLPRALLRRGQRARSNRSSGISTPWLVLAALAAALALACLAWALARAFAYEPRWLLSTRHALAEGGYRASATWAELLDWARMGR